MLEWKLDDDGVYRASDQYALYIISIENGRYRVGFFPAPGPECHWAEPHDDFEGAKASAELCVECVAQWRRDIDLR